jgi:hypothetical protein
MLRRHPTYIILVVLILKPALHLYGHGTTTHAAISANAYGAAANIQRNFFQALPHSAVEPFIVGTGSNLETRTAQSWIVQGSIREDTGTLPIGSTNVGSGGF